MQKPFRIVGLAAAAVGLVVYLTGHRPGQAAAPEPSTVAYGCGVKYKD